MGPYGTNHTILYTSCLVAEENVKRQTHMYQREIMCKITIIHRHSSGYSSVEDSKVLKTWQSNSTINYVVFCYHFSGRRVRQWWFIGKHCTRRTVLYVRPGDCIATHLNYFNKKICFRRNNISVNRSFSNAQNGIRLRWTRVQTNIKRIAPTGRRGELSK